MKVKLFIKERTSGSETSGVFEIDRDHCLIGRRETDVKLADVSCSRQHALLYAGPDGRPRIKDLDSTNGTFVRGKSVTDCGLRVGDEIRIGEALIVVVDFQTEDAAPTVSTQWPDHLTSLPRDKQATFSSYRPRTTRDGGAEDGETSPLLQTTGQTNGRRTVIGTPPEKFKKLA